MQVFFKYSRLFPLFNSICRILFFYSYHWADISDNTYSWFDYESEDDYFWSSYYKVGALPSKDFTHGKCFSTPFMYVPLSFDTGLLYRESYFKFCNLLNSLVSKLFISIRLLAKYNFYSFTSLATFYTTEIKLFFKFTSFSPLSGSIPSIREISLCDKFNILKFCKFDTPSIFDILLLCKSKTYSLTRSLVPRIRLIWFFGNNNTLIVGKAKFSISLIRLS